MPPVTPPVNPPITGEGEYLQQQADEAKAAVVKALQQAKAAISGAVDPREVTRSHPFIAVGSAVLAGFVAALVAIPSKEQQELWRVEKMHRAMHPDPIAPAVDGAKNGHGSAKPPQSLWATILKEAIAVLKPILIAAVTSGINAHTASPPPATPDSTNPGDRSPDNLSSI